MAKSKKKMCLFIYLFIQLGSLVIKQQTNHIASHVFHMFEIVQLVPVLVEQLCDRVIVENITHVQMVS